MPIQLHQNINLFLLLILGVLTANITLGWEEIVWILLFSIAIEHLFIYLKKGRVEYFSYSALSTAIGVVILIYASSLWIYFFLIALGLGQKHLLRVRGKHFFNPSNFSVVMALLLFYNDAHMILGQLGEDWLLAAILSVLAMSILVRVNRWVIPLVFLLSYLLLEYLLILFYDPVTIFQDIYHRFYSVTSILFVYFMLTDPLVTPKSYKNQILFAFLVALFAVLLDRFLGYRVQHLFLSLFFFSFFVNTPSLKELREEEVKLLVTILFFVVGSTLYIEWQPPYYFEMNG